MTATSKTVNPNASRLSCNALGIKELQGKIKTLATNEKNRSETIQLLALQCVKHIVLHGNTTPLNDLYAAIRVGKGLFKVWLGKHTDLGFDSKEGKFFLKPKWYTKLDQWKLEDLEKTPWDGERAKADRNYEYTSQSLDASFESFMKRLDTFVSKGDMDTAKKASELKAKLVVVKSGVATPKAA